MVQAEPGGEPQIHSLYDNYTAAEDCVEAGRAAGLIRWRITHDLEDEYVLEDDLTIPSEENNHG